ncbi:MAG: hypothetical protein ACPLPT_05930 [Moorellales bacterium]
MKFLLVTDDPETRASVRLWLGREFGRASFVELTKPEELSETLAASGFDAAVVVSPLTWTSPRSVLETLKSRGRVPVVLVNREAGGAEEAREAMRTGLCDYVLSSSLLHLLGQVPANSAAVQVVEPLCDGD